MSSDAVPEFAEGFPGGDDLPFEPVCLLTTEGLQRDLQARFTAFALVGIPAPDAPEAAARRVLIAHGNAAELLLGLEHLKLRLVLGDETDGPDSVQQPDSETREKEKGAASEEWHQAGPEPAENGLDSSKVSDFLSPEELARVTAALGAEVRGVRPVTEDPDTEC